MDHPSYLFIGSINDVRPMLSKVEKPAKHIVCTNEPSKWDCVTVSPKQLKFIAQQQRINEIQRIEQSMIPRTEAQRLCIVVDDIAILDEDTRKDLLYNGRCFGIQKMWGSATSEGFEQFDHVVYVTARGKL
jgi:hypothetical protein